ncbi:beta-soluble NSF attachment protein isoform X4 [Homo sapiens]|uniref:beta-soluble NSF attachment protein isoform X4 n=1 Tax=Homo sapiens TaxID=9606 RepID=UPI0005D01CD4|nr:beta-soluble NSF attachment protein isoform X4 [Homo sapiens]XP_054179784.1 beta-soluble NSF attachment protein isoform X4 [Homo sapiens]
MDNAGKEREAVQLMAEAEKRVKASHSFLRGLFGGNTRIEEACEMYTRAANMFKMAKNWSAAGNAFCQAAKLHMQLQSKHDSATSFVDAGNAYKKADPQVFCLDGVLTLRLRVTKPMLLQLQFPKLYYSCWEQSHADESGLVHDFCLLLINLPTLHSKIIPH